MAPNKRKMLEAARKYAQKGAKDRALREYEQLLKLDPKDAKLRLEVADAHRRWGQIEEAAAAYRRVAEQYTDEGFDARAVAVYKQIQSLDTDRFDACEPLAELYQRMGLVSEAIVALQAAADGQAREGNKRRALELLRRMAGLDPSNTASRIKIADLLRQEKMNEEAAAEYDAAAAELERQGETEAAGRVIERLLELQPDRVDVLVRLARNLLGRQKAAQAEAPALRATERDPQDVEALEVLADVYRALRRDDRLEDAYRKIAGIYRERGDSERARDILQRFVSGGEFEAPAAAAPREEPALSFGSEPLELDDRGLDSELLPEDDLLFDDPAPAPPAKAAAPAATVAAPRSAPRPPAAPRPEAAEETIFELGAQEGSRILGDPEQLLAEASVYLRYGKRAQAIENLQAILATQPQHRGALEKLGDAYADDGDAAGAVAAWLRAAELARDEGALDVMRLLRDRVGALDEAAAATLFDPEAEEADALESTGAGFDAIDLDAELAAAGPARVGMGPGETAGGSEAELDFDLDGIDLDDAGIPAEAPAEATPPAETTEEIEISLDDEPAVEEPAPIAASAAGAVDAEQVAADLEEAEFYWQQGLAEEARPLFEKVLACSQGHPLALVRLGEIAAAAGRDPDATGDDVLAGALPSGSASEPPTGPPDEAGGEGPGAWLAEDDDPFLDVEAGEDALDASSGPGVLDDAVAAPPGIGALDDAVAAPPGIGALDAAAAAPPDPGAPDDAPDEERPPTPPVLDRDLAFPLEADTTGGGPRPEGAGGVAERPAPPLARPGDFDLAAELSAALDSVAGDSGGPASGDEGFQAVFDAFKRGVQQALGTHDHQAHYDLGIAYREMGLLDDAIREFRSAMESPTRRIDCLHMLGLCALELGRGEEAVDWLAHALAAPDLAQEQELAIRFELGRAYNGCGDVAKARLAWEKVAAVDPSFCEVGELLVSLGEAPEAAPSAPAVAEFESFGDLIEEARAGDEAAPAEPHESFDDLMQEVAADSDAPAARDGRSEPRSEAPAPAREERPRRRKISFV